MNSSLRFQFFLWLGFLVSVFLLTAGTGAAKNADSEKPVEAQYDAMPALEMAERAVVDTLYYRFGEWFPRFKLARDGDIPCKILELT